MQTSMHLRLVPAICHLFDDRGFWYFSATPDNPLYGKGNVALKTHPNDVSKSHSGGNGCLLAFLQIGSVDPFDSETFDLHPIPLPADILSLPPAFHFWGLQNCFVLGLRWPEDLHHYSKDWNTLRRRRRQKTLVDDCDAKRRPWTTTAVAEEQMPMAQGLEQMPSRRQSKSLVSSWCLSFVRWLYKYWMFSFS